MPMLIFELLLGLLAFCLLLAWVSERTKVPFAVPLVLGGMAVAFIPGLPPIELEPELALALFLPPLLQLSAYRTDWPAFRSNLRPILLLATGAVFFTAACVAAVAKWLVPDLPWGAAIALGAIVAPPDAVAAAAVLKNLRPPRRIAAVLEGESLLNDAASLVLFRFAVAATIAGEFSLGKGALDFVLAAVGGTVIGYAIGRLAMVVFRMLDDTVHDITGSVLTAFAAYFAAEAAHVSGVLGIVASGLVLGRHQHHVFTARTRLESKAVWDFINFVLTSLIFMLIGLQLPGIVERLTSHEPRSLALLALGVTGALIASRFVWVWVSAIVPRVLFAKLRARDPLPPPSHLFVLSWAGMRGVVSLAAALALPARFPGRDLIVFLAFCAILGTLVVQGTTLGPLIRRLGVVEPDREGPHPDQVVARRQVAEAALTAVEKHLDHPEHGEAAQELVDEYKERVEQVARLDDGGEDEADRAAAQLRVRLAAIEAARAGLADEKDDVDDTAARAVTEELDLEEEQIRREMGEREG